MFYRPVRFLLRCSWQLEIVVRPVEFNQIESAESAAFNKFCKPRNQKMLRRFCRGPVQKRSTSRRGKSLAVFVVGPVERQMSFALPRRCLLFAKAHGLETVQHADSLGAGVRSP